MEICRIPSQAKSLQNCLPHHLLLCLKLFAIGQHLKYAEGFQGVMGFRPHAGCKDFEQEFRIEDVSQSKLRQIGLYPLC